MRGTIRRKRQGSRLTQKILHWMLKKVISLKLQLNAEKLGDNNLPEFGHRTEEEDKYDDSYFDLADHRLIFLRWVEELLTNFCFYFKENACFIFK